MRRNLPVYGFVFYYFVFFGLSGFLIQSPSSVSASSLSWQQYTYSNLAGSRPYFVHTPENYHVGIAVPLVVMLHGCTQTATDFAIGTKMNQLADQYKFIVVYPQQMNIYNQSLCWNWFEPSNQIRGDGEPAIIAGIIQTVEQNTSQWTIDTHRVYVAGFSAGAAMAVILGATYPDIFAAIGVHSGLEFQAATNTIDSLKVMSLGGPDPKQRGQAAFDAMGTTTRVIPTIVYQGSNDPVVHSINGDQVTQQWIRTDQLASDGTYKAEFGKPSHIENGQVPDGHSYSVFKWNDSQGNELQEFWKIDDMGHAWSGGSSGNSYTDPSGPNASLAMIQFFMCHPFTLSDLRARSQCVAT
jgi:poly(hydroxyalkanoate) depolymerase family esterase